ncbi:MAG: aminotransferase class V-fold PLP-dependent enzyme [Defluviitaleaceae bacterium]|nr:aminotransferase class V-fold PLP-dependent enzyme [Defluviitaleaceae bacterium]
MIYLDNAATTQPLYAAALGDEAFFANPSSPHALGIAAERAMAKARQTIADILLCKPKEIIFTSGGTESNNLAIIGYVSALRKANTPPVIFAEPWAHPSVLAPLHHAVERKSASGCVGPRSGWDIPVSGPVMVCLSHVNHETGDLTDIAAITRELKSLNPDAVIFVDGAQGFCKDLNAAEVYKHADVYSFSGHKCHAPAGVGGLVVRGGIKLAPLLYGGGQENAMRSGTENVAGIVRTAYAAQQLHDDLPVNYIHVKNLRDSLAGLVSVIPNATVNTLNQNANNSPYILNLSFPGTKGEVLVHMLSEKGIYMSTGTACKSRKNDKSTLMLMGFPNEITESAVRFGFSHLNTAEEIERTKEALIACVNQLRKIRGYR